MNYPNYYHIPPIYTVLLALQNMSSSEDRVSFLVKAYLGTQDPEVAIPTELRCLWHRFMSSESGGPSTVLELMTAVAASEDYMYPELSVTPDYTNYLQSSRRTKNPDGTYALCTRSAVREEASRSKPFGFGSDRRSFGFWSDTINTAFYPDTIGDSYANTLREIEHSRQGESPLEYEVALENEEQASAYANPQFWESWTKLLMDNFGSDKEIVPSDFPESVVEALNTFSTILHGKGYREVYVTDINVEDATVNVQLLGGSGRITCRFRQDATVDEKSSPWNTFGITIDLRCLHNKAEYELTTLHGLDKKELRELVLLSDRSELKCLYAYDHSNNDGEYLTMILGDKVVHEPPLGFDIGSVSWTSPDGVSNTLSRPGIPYALDSKRSSRDSLGMQPLLSMGYNPKLWNTHYPGRMQEISDLPDSLESSVTQLNYVALTYERGVMFCAEDNDWGVISTPNDNDFPVVSCVLPVGVRCIGTVMATRAFWEGRVAYEMEELVTAPSYTYALAKLEEMHGGAIDPRIEEGVRAMSTTLSMMDDGPAICLGVHTLTNGTLVEMVPGDFVYVSRFLQSVSHQQRLVELDKEVLTREINTILQHNMDVEDTVELKRLFASNLIDYLRDHDIEKVECTFVQTDTSLEKVRLVFKDKRIPLNDENLSTVVSGDDNRIEVFVPFRQDEPPLDIEFFDKDHWTQVATDIVGMSSVDYKTVAGITGDIDVVVPNDNVSKTLGLIGSALTVSTLRVVADGLGMVKLKCVVAKGTNYKLRSSVYGLRLIFERA